MLLQSETLYVCTAVIHDMMDKSNATYVTIWTINNNNNNNGRDRLVVRTLRCGRNNKAP